MKKLNRIGIDSEKIISDDDLNSMIYTKKRFGDEVETNPPMKYLDI